MCFSLEDKSNTYELKKKEGNIKKEKCSTAMLLATMATHNRCPPDFQREDRVGPTPGQITALLPLCAPAHGTEPLEPSFSPCPQSPDDYRREENQESCTEPNRKEAVGQLLFFFFF